jgi:hypothetical protein
MSENTYRRYTPGKNYCFARIVARNRNSDATVRTGFFDPRHHDFVSIELLLLRCERHESVAWEFDPRNEKKHDGFVFTEVTDTGSGRTFHNQYPVASFGQISDAANYRVRIATMADDLLKLDASERDAGSDMFSAITSPYEDAFHLLGNFARAALIGSERKIDAYWSPDQSERFNAVFEALKEAVEAALGRPIAFRDAIITFTNGKPPETLPGYLEAYIPDRDAA